MKKLIWTVIALCSLGIFAALLTRHSAGVKKDTIYIALAGPMSGSDQEEGRAMLRGAILAYEEVKREGRLLKNKKIEIIPYDDKNSQNAAHIATEIMHENKVLLVLGHYSSSSSAAAGPIYLREGIPAITASAAVKSVTMENDWFFRTIPPDHTMTEFVVHSMRQLLGVTSTTASMIYDVHFYDTTAEIFKEKAENIFDTLRIWSFDSNSDNKENNLKKIIGEIRAEESDSIGPIFFATGSQDCARLISGFRYPGTNYPIIGFGSLSTSAFIEQFNHSSEKKENTGHYTDGIYAVSPFISYLADQPNARSFREKFVRAFDREPLRWEATYYDAMLVALNAVEQAEVQGENIQEDRRRVKDALSSINEKDVAVNGVTGEIYFDEDGNVDLPLALGVWQNYEFIPAYRQDKLSNSAVSDTKQAGGSKGGGNEAQDRKKTDESKATPLRVVYTGVDINAVRNIDLKKGVFTADFYLWFRFKGVFEDTAVKFINAVDPVILEEPIIDEVKRDNGVTVRTYRVTANFTIENDMIGAYPLDLHTLSINFRHLEETRKTMIYIPDVIGLTGSVGKKNRGETMLKKISGWEVSEIASRQNIRTVALSKKKKHFYSGIDTKIRIQREGREILAGKILLPVFVIMMCSYLLFFLSPEKIRFRLVALSSLLLLMVGIRILYGYILPGQDIIQGMMYLVFALIIFSALISGGAYWTHQRDYNKTTKCILYKGSFLYLAAALAGIGFLSYSYALWPSQLTEIFAQKEIMTWFRSLLSTS